MNLILVCPLFPDVIPCTPGWSSHTNIFVRIFIHLLQRQALITVLTCDQWQNVHLQWKQSRGYLHPDIFVCFAAVEVRYAIFVAYFDFRESASSFLSIFWKFLLSSAVEAQCVSVHLSACVPLVTPVKGVRQQSIPPLLCSSSLPLVLPAAGWILVLR